MSDEPDETHVKRAGNGRTWKIAAGIAVLCAVAAMGALGYLLFAADDSNVGADVRACIQNHDFTAQEPKGGSSGIAGDKSKTEVCPRPGDKYVDGLLQDATASGFNIVTTAGKKISLNVRPADRPYIDIEHAQSHANLGQPIRLYYEKIDGDNSIVFLMDVPLDGSGKPMK
ncbi:MAG: hypothetical protein ABI200_05795 [Gaiellales bacterium]